MPNNTRKTVIAGNWKMNKTPAEAVALIKEIRTEIDGKNTAGCDVVACVPYVDLAVVLEACKGSVIKVGAENVHWEKSGAYTGEISADMLKEIGVEYVIVGHSERRQYFGETDETVNLRVKAALAAGLKVILCVGELLAQREQGITDEVVSLQTKVALQGVGAEALKNVIIAYEPVWAIGTGLTATPEQADETCGVIRATVAKIYSPKAAEEITIQYGGSMNDKNAAELLAKKNVNGGLIGGASLSSLLSQARRGAAPETAPEAAEQPQPAVTIDPASGQKLESGRTAILDYIRQERPRLYAFFEQLRIEGHTLRLAVPTEALREEILRSKLEMLTRIAAIAGVEGALELEVTINEQIRAVRPIKLEDRLRHMNEKNPLLAELRRELDLEVE